MIYYYLGCCALGLATGFLVGGSASPVVQTILPLLFALVGSGAAILGLTADPASARSKARFRITGLAIGAIAVPFLCAALYASLIRTGAGIGYLIPVLTQEKVPPLLDEQALGILGPDESLQILILDRNMRLAGVAPTSINSTIRYIVNNRVKDINNFVSKRAKLLIISGKLLPILKSKPENFENSGIVSLIENLNSFISIATGRSDRPTAVELEKIADITGNLTSDILLSETVKMFATDPTVAPLVAEILALTADVPNGSMLSDATKTEITNAVEAAGKLPAGAATNIPILAEERNIREGQI